jgi:hypothetical protein
VLELAASAHRLAIDQNHPNHRQLLEVQAVQQITINPNRGRGNGQTQMMWLLA